MVIFNSYVSLPEGKFHSSTIFPTLHALQWPSPPFPMPPGVPLAATSVALSAVRGGLPPLRLKVQRSLAWHLAWPQPIFSKRLPSNYHQKLPYKKASTPGNPHWTSKEQEEGNNEFHIYSTPQNHPSYHVIWGAWAVKTLTYWKWWICVGFNCTSVGFLTQFATSQDKYGLAKKDASPPYKQNVQFAVYGEKWTPIHHFKTNPHELFILSRVAPHFCSLNLRHIHPCAIKSHFFGWTQQRKPSVNFRPAT